MTSDARATTHTATRGLAIGVAASWIKAMSEPPLQRVAERLVPPAPEEKQLVGADPSGHPDNMPPAVLVARVAPRLGVPQPDRAGRIRAAQVIHYAFGSPLGSAYLAAARGGPATSWMRGALAGLALYTATHGTLLPLLRVQPPPWRLPASAVLWESASHVVFGLSLEAGRRATSLARPT